MTIKVRLPDNTIVTPLSIVVESRDGSITDFALDSLIEAAKQENAEKEKALTIFLDAHFYLRDSSEFIKGFKDLYPNERTELLELLQNV